MPINTYRPTSTISNGSWSKTPSGGTIHGILSDDNDLTYISTTSKCRLPSQFAVFDINDVSLPVGSKIFSVRVKIRVLQVTPPTGSSFIYDILRFYGELVEEVLEDTGLGFLSDFLAHIFGFDCPKQTGGSPSWQTVDLAYYTEKPSGGEWTEDVLNALEWRIGRSDNNGQTAKISEYYVEVDYNERPTVTINGPVTSRSVTDGVTTNADATFTSATAAFTSADVGSKISGSGIPASTTISSINSSTSVEMSSNATASATGVATTIASTTITDTTRPLVLWLYDDAEGDQQEAYRVKIFNEAQYSAAGFNVETSVPFAQTDWTLSQASQWPCPTDLPNDNYRVFVQARQVWHGFGEHRSEWDSYDFTVDVPGPPVPTLTVTVNNDQSWVQIDLAPSDVSPATETYNVYYSDDSGVNWHLVRGGFQALADENGLATIYDYEAPLNRARWYRALGYRTLNTIKVASDFSDFATATPKSNKFRLKDPLAPSLNMAIVVYDDKPKQTRNQGVFRPLSADGKDTYVFVVNAPRYGIEGDIVFVFVGPDDTSGWNAFNAIIDSGRTLLLQYPTGEQHYIAFGPEVTQEWGMRDRGVHYRKAKVSYYEVARPDDPNSPVS